MSVVRKKVLLLGLFGSGKTSIFRRYIDGCFTEKYVTTMGVSVEAKKLQIAERAIELVIWDIADTDDFYKMSDRYYKNTSGAFLVADTTRERSLDKAMAYKKKLWLECGPVPVVFLLNKSDLNPASGFENTLTAMSGHQPLMRTSAKNGSNIDASFRLLANKIVETSRGATAPESKKYFAK